MTFDLTKWLTVWEKCPELRPEGLKYNPAIGWLFSQTYFGKDSRVGLAPSGAAALIRDKAVIVAGEKWNLSMVHQDVPEPHWKIVRWEALHDGDYAAEIVRRVDPLDALYIAVCMTLGLTPAM